MRATQRRCARPRKPTRSDHRRRPLYVDLVSPWRLLGYALLLAGLGAFWAALALGVFVGPPWGALGLLAWMGAWCFAAECWEQGSERYSEVKASGLREGEK